MPEALNAPLVLNANLGGDLPDSGAIVLESEGGADALEDRWLPR